MNPVRLLPVLPTMILLLSCTRESALVEPGTGRDIALMFSQTGVKTVLNSSRNQLLWQEGDEISVFNDYDGNVATAIYKAGETIKVTVPAGATSITAVYPSSDVKDVAPALSQSQRSPGVLYGGNYPLKAHCAIESSTAHLQFSAVGCALALNIFNPSQEGERLLSVSVKPSQLSDTYCTAMDTTFVLDMSEPSDRRLYGKQVYVCLPKGIYSYVRFTVVTDAGSYAVTTNAQSMDCSGYDFRVLNLNLAKYSVIDITSSLQDPSFDPDDETFAEASTPYDLDFSSAGYHYGEAEFPQRPVGKIITLEDYAQANAASPIDTTTYLTQAISSTPSGTAILIGAGTWNISGPLNITSGNVTVRGLMTPEGDTTRIHACGTKQYTAMTVGKTLERGISLACLANVSDEHVPVGAWYVNVDNPGYFSKGCRVTVFRQAVEGWINAIHMGEDIVDVEGHNWLEDIREHDIVFERKVTAVSGSRIYFDAPVPMSLDKCWGGATVALSAPIRISEVGIEDILFDSNYDPAVLCTPQTCDKKVPQNKGQYNIYGPYPCDENHANSALVFKAAEHCRAKGIVTRHFIFGAVGLASGARNVTVQECRSECPISIITGSRRYAFRFADGAELCLVKDCECWEDRHAFVTPANCTGPNVFLRCTAHRNFSNLGPHCYWATYLLYDNVRSIDNYYASFSGNTIRTSLSVEDVGGQAHLSSHGWQGANHVLWNCQADYIQCQSPWVTGTNWAWGCTCTKRWGASFNADPRGKDPSSWVKGDDWRPDGNWNPEAIGEETLSLKMPETSLYEKQLSDRLSSGRTLF